MDCPPLSALTVNEDLLQFGSFATAPSPALRAAQQLTLALQRQGIAIGHRAHTGVHPASARKVAAEPSPTMHRLVFEMDQVSDNFFAETLTKDLAVAAGRLGTTRSGVALTRRYLQSLGVDLAGAALLRRIRPLEGRPALGPPDRRHPPARGRAAVRVVLPPRAAAGRRQRHAREADAVGAGAPKRARQDRHARRGLGALGLRHRRATATAWRSRS